MLRQKVRGPPCVYMVLKDSVVKREVFSVQLIVFMGKEGR